MCDMAAACDRDEMGVQSRRAHGPRGRVVMFGTVFRMAVEKVEEVAGATAEDRDRR